MGDRYFLAPDEEPDDTRFARWADRVGRRLTDLIYPLRIFCLLILVFLWLGLIAVSVVNAVSAGRAVHRELADGRTPSSAIAVLPALLAVGVPTGLLYRRRRLGNTETPTGDDHRDDDDFAPSQDGGPDPDEPGHEASPTDRDEEPS